MKTCILLFTLFLSTILPSSARIGETLDQCRSRYGPENKELVKDAKSESVFFVKNGYVLRFMFDSSGKARFAEVYKMADGNFSIKNAIPMTDEERTILLNANGNGKKWIINRDQVFTEDKKYKAYGFHAGSKALTVICQDRDTVAEKASSAKAATNAQKSLQGF